MNKTQHNNMVAEKILTDERGNRFKVSNLEALIPLDPMPDLEKGDWYITRKLPKFWENNQWNQDDLHKNRIKEIRKSNGQVWKK